MNKITKIKVETAEDLLRKRFMLFNKEIIIPYKEYKKIEMIDENIVIAIKIQGNYFTFED